MSMKPDWVVLGTPHDDGKVAVFASKTLTKAELIEELDRLPDLDDWLPLEAQEPNCRIDLRVEMKDFLLIVASTYEQALRGLFESWSPEPERQAIAVPQRAIAAREAA